MTMADDALAGITKGAALGSIVPGVGTAIGAAAGGLLGVAFNLAPGLQHLLADNADTVANVEGAVQAITGTANPTQAQAALDADPDGIKTELQRQLAEIAADRFKAQLADVADARATTVQLVQAGTPMAWGAAVVSGLFLVMFMVDMGLLYFAPIPTDAATLASLSPMHTTIQNAIIAVIGYWIGSSAGSASKDARLANSVPTSMLSKPLTSDPK